jgi:hypothetical protein
MKYSLILILFTFSCQSVQKQQYESDLPSIYKNHNYENLDSAIKLRNESDTILFNIIQLKQNRKNIKPYHRELDSFYFIDVKGIKKSSNSPKLTSVFRFPYKNYSAIQVYYAGYYFDSKYNYEGGLFLPIFLRESLKRDTNNILVMYDLSKYFLRAEEYPRAYYLMNLVSNRDRNWVLARKMRNYLEEQMKGDYSKEHYSSIHEVLKDSIYPLGFVQDKSYKNY